MFVDPHMAHVKYAFIYLSTLEKQSTFTVKENHVMKEEL